MQISELNFQRCEDEPIHIPGKIQPLGYFIAIDSVQTICYISQNVEQLGFDSKRVIDTPLQNSFVGLDRYVKAFIKDHKTDQRKLFTDLEFDFSKKVFDLYISQKDGICILELLPQTTESVEYKTYNYIDHVQLLSASNTKQELFKNVVNCVKELTQYDRVMLYRFDSEYNGEVIAEAKEDSLEPYLHLHYPASDIPPQARQLYLKNPIRVIADVDYSVCDIVAKKERTVDMSLSFLRSVSPIHLQYMKNMGVYASMTISIIIEGKLWGLIACHHKSPHLPQTKVTDICEKMSGVVSSLIHMFEKREREASWGKFLATVETISSVIKSNITAGDGSDFVRKNLATFLSLFEAQGLIVKQKEMVISSGGNLSQLQIKSFAQAVQELEFSENFTTTSLANYCKDLDEQILKSCAGVVAIRIEEFDALFIFTKPEQIETIEWGGDPTKQVQSLSPRTSFEKFAQTVTKRSLPWAIDIDMRMVVVKEKFVEVFRWQHSQQMIEVQQDTITTLQEEKAQYQSQLIDLLIAMIEQRDAYTAGHTQRVATYCVMIAKELGLSEYEIELVDQAAKLHDVGKVSIPDSILLKPGRLNFNEYSLIKKHLDVGYDILSKIDYYKDVADIMCHHHEKYDGSGYPFGKKEEEIPLLGHVMIVADALDAMTTNRIYQNKKSVDEAVEEIEVLSGVWYHPDVVDALLKLHKKGAINPSASSQLPLTQMEHERFSYFFKDQLTAFFNASYLWMILNDGIPTKELEHFVMIEMRGMTQYNKVHGWQTGSVLITNIAKYIKKQYDSSDIFRVFGDDFILGFEDSKTKEQFLAQWQEVKVGTVHTVIKDITKGELFSKMQAIV